jgi:dihydroneopterin aldolase
MDCIRITGIQAMGVHGVLPEEQTRPQPFEVDVEMRLDLEKACASDSLDDTVDYGAVSESVARVVSSERYQLLERLAAQIADVCLADPRVEHVVVEVRKMHAPVRAQIEHVAVCIER